MNEDRKIDVYQDTCDHCKKVNKLISDTKYPASMPGYSGRTIWWCWDCQRPNFREKGFSNQEAAERGFAATPNKEKS